MNKGPHRLIYLLPLLALFLTGCPHEQFIITLTPRGNTIERQLIFYREDGLNSNGLPNYQSLLTNELAQIQNLYPPGGVTSNALRYTATGQFAAALPDDVGGAGSYAAYSNSLGTAGIYMERIRGDDDFVGRIAKRTHDIDRLVDIIIGWSHQEFRHERHYRDLHKFLDEDFRHDMHNFGFYGWMFQASLADQSSAPEEYLVRFGQYLIERGYLRIDDLPALNNFVHGPDEHESALLIQRVIAAKLKIPGNVALPPSVAALTNPGKLAASWAAYLETTDLYEVKVREWQKQKFKRDVNIATDQVTKFLLLHTNTAATPGPPAKPDPNEVASDIMQEILDPFNMLGNPPDHCLVRLNLTAPPTHTNGKWNTASNQVAWDADLDPRETNITAPVFCYANWVVPNPAAQKACFGEAVLRDDNLLQYSFWRASLDDQRAAEWETFLKKLNPGGDLHAQLQNFRFTADLGNATDTFAQARTWLEDAINKPPSEKK